MNIVEFKNAGIKFRERWIFRGVNLAIRQGECVVLLGPSGAGKSAFLKLCLGLLSPSEGEILCYGEKSPLQLWKNCGVLFQTDALFDDMTSGENLVFASDNPAIVSDTAVKNSLAKFGLEDIDIHQKPAALSGGMRKRLSLARALFNNPSVIFIDEPTSGLDPVNADRIISYIDDVHQNNSENPPTIITITHDPSCAAKLGDRILLIDKSSKQIKEISQYEFHASGFETLFLEKPASVHNDSGNKQNISAFLNIADNFFSLIGSAYINLRNSLCVPDLYKTAGRFYTDVLGSLPFITGVCLIIGFLLAMQSGASLAKLGFIGSVPYILAKSSFEDIGYLLIGFLLSGRLATSYCAEMWKKNLNNETEAVKVMGKSPWRMFSAPVLVSYIIGFPLIFLIGQFAMLTGGIVFAASGIGGSQLTTTYFVNNAVKEISLLMILAAIAKGIITALIITIVPLTAASESDNLFFRKTSTPIPQSVVICMVLIVLFNFIYP